MMREVAAQIWGRLRIRSSDPRRLFWHRVKAGAVLVLLLMMIREMA